MPNITIYSNPLDKYFRRSNRNNVDVNAKIKALQRRELAADGTVATAKHLAAVRAVKKAKIKRLIASRI
jgi:hypothetical protein